MSVLLETRGLGATVANRRLYGGLDLSLAGGQCWGVLGPNGAGKTTLLLTLAGLRRAAEGEVRLEGRPLADWPSQARARRLGVLLQDNREVFPSTVLETALIGRHPHLGRWRQEDETDLALARAALADVDLAGFEDRGVDTLSGGEYQRLQIAVVLAQAPRVMLLDEPVNHLDLRHQRSVLATLRARARRQDHALLMVLHDINLAARFCDHILLLHGDGETLQGRREDILRRETLERLYGCPLRELEDGEGGRWFVVGE
ncbi:MAG TPA: ABC transporter ATP-binding protein [Gammaproteobacteria bacterium]|nr:ABC transporter ATP-binding protein [Gammaproteobacteria bacterium]